VLINPYEVDLDKTQDVDIKEIADKFTYEKSKVINDYFSNRISESALDNEIIAFLAERKISSEKLKDVKDMLFGYGILQPYIDDPDITDTLVNDPETIFIKKYGNKMKVNKSFKSEQELLKYCQKIVAMNGGTINQNQAQAVVTDKIRNLRIVVSLPPISAKSPTICIRKPSASQSLLNLEKSGMFDGNTRERLKQMVKNYKTIIIAGKGGSGKTTLMGALINEIPLNDRALLIQETMEIVPKHPDIITQLVRISDNPEVKNYTLFDLTRAALLQSLDRIFIGEMKDKEAFDFFNAVYTGHKGSMATIHANSADEVINRLLYLMSRADSDMKEDTLREMLENSLDVVIFLEKYKIKEIKELR